MTEPEALPGVTVVLLNWNGRHWLERFLPALLATDYPGMQVLLVDNASTDDSLDWAATHYPQLRIEANARNYGFAEGNNRALPHLHTPYFVLLNTDVEVTPGWLRPLIARLQADPEAAAVQPAIRCHDAPELFEYAGAAGGWMDRHGIPFARGRVMDHLERDEGQYQAAPCFWASGACMALRTAAVQQLGLFDPRFFAHMEEIDFCWRAQQAGWRIWAEPASIVYHVGGGTLPKTSPHKTYLNVRNSLWAATKNLRLRELIPLLLVRIATDKLAAWRYLATGQYKLGWAVWRGQLAFWRSFRYAWRQRPQALRPFHDLQGTTRKSLLSEVFLRKKTTFREIAGQ